MPKFMVAIAHAAPGIAMLAVFALIFGAIRLYRQPGPRQKPVLMLVLAAVLFGNVLIWTLL